MARKAPQKAGRKTTPAAKPAPIEQREGVMTPEDFELILSDALGGRGWQKSFRAGTGMAQSTITRYLRGVIPIPQHVGIICEMLQTLRRNKLPVPEAFTSR